MDSIVAQLTVELTKKNERIEALQRQLAAAVALGSPSGATAPSQIGHSSRDGATFEHRDDQRMLQRQLRDTAQQLEDSQRRCIDATRRFQRVISAMLDATLRDEERGRRLLEESRADEAALLFPRGSGGVVGGAGQPSWVIATSVPSESFDGGVLRPSKHVDVASSPGLPPPSPFRQPASASHSASTKVSASPPAIPSNPNQLGTPVSDTTHPHWYLVQCVKVGLVALFAPLSGDEADVVATPSPAAAAPKPGTASSAVGAVVSGFGNVMVAATGMMTSAVTAMMPLAQAQVVAPIQERLGAMTNGYVGGAAVANAAVGSDHGSVYFHLEHDTPTMMYDSPSTTLPPIDALNLNRDLTSRFRSSDAPMASSGGSSSNGVGSAASLENASLADGNAGSASNLSSATSQIVYRADQLRFSVIVPSCCQRIRFRLGISDNFLKYCLLEAPWREATSPGKSESQFFYFANYVIKETKAHEFKFLVEQYLPQFERYAANNPHSLLPQFACAFVVRWLKSGETRRYVLMNNVFSTSSFISKIYDLKGSSVGRTAGTTEGTVQRTAFGAVLLKDNDVPEHLIVCGPLRRAIVLAQLNSDTMFLSELKVVDYSLLVGVRSRLRMSTPIVSQRIHATTSPDTRAALSGGDEASLMQSGAPGACLRSEDGGMRSLPINTDEDSSTTREDTYYLGLVDVLQTFNSSKKVEHFVKGMIHDRSKISIIPPDDFAKRLTSFVEKISM